MAHYAFIKDGIVTEVIVGKDENDTDSLPDEFSSWEECYLSKRPGQDACKRTSYNTRRNAHLLGGTAFRGNFAGIGMSYDEDADVFIPERPSERHNYNSDVADWVDTDPFPSP
jgi:hypothetical protein